MSESVIAFLEVLRVLDGIHDHQRVSVSDFIDETGFTARALAALMALRMARATAPPVYLQFASGRAGRMSAEYGPLPFVRLTEKTLRVGPDGDVLAALDGTQWVLTEDSGARDEDRDVARSDVIVTTAPSR